MMLWDCFGGVEACVFQLPSIMNEFAYNCLRVHSEPLFYGTS